MSNLKIYPLKQIETLLGFASKSGKIAAGDNATKDKLRKGYVYLIILASDASRELVDYYVYHSEKQRVPFLCSGKKLELGKAVGKSQRGVIGITDKQLAVSIVKLVREKEGMD